MKTSLPKPIKIKFCKPYCKICGCLRSSNPIPNTYSKASQRQAFCYSCFKENNRIRLATWRTNNPEAWKAIYTRCNRKARAYQRQYYQDHKSNKVYIGTI